MHYSQEVNLIGATGGSGFSIELPALMREANRLGQQHREALLAAYNRQAAEQLGLVAPVDWNQLCNDVQLRELAQVVSQ